MIYGCETWLMKVEVQLDRACMCMIRSIWGMGIYCGRKEEKMWMLFALEPVSLMIRKDK